MSLVAAQPLVQVGTAMLQSFFSSIVVTQEGPSRQRVRVRSVQASKDAAMSSQSPCGAPLCVFSILSTIAA